MICTSEACEMCLYGVKPGCNQGSKCIDSRCCSMRKLEEHAWHIVQRAQCYGKRGAGVLRWKIEGISKKEIRNIHDK